MITYMLILVGGRTQLKWTPKLRVKNSVLLVPRPLVTVRVHSLCRVGLGISITTRLVLVYVAVGLMICSFLVLVPGCDPEFLIRFICMLIFELCRPSVRVRFRDLHFRTVIPWFRTTDRLVLLLQNSLVILLFRMGGPRIAL